MREHLARPRRRPDAKVQVAFYGGSFTCLPFARQKDLLGAVRPFLEANLVDSLRLSTRPDCVTAENAVFLREQGVKVVELGAQSLDDRVLSASDRGHSAAQVAAAVACLKEAGLRVGLQLMLGLPGESTAGLMAAARRAALLAPDLVRLYPCLVIAGSPLASLYRQGHYRPLGMSRAIALAGRLWQIFTDRGISVARMGLQPSSVLEQSVLAGPYHPAFGELVLSRLLFKRVRSVLAGRPFADRPCRLALAREDESLYRGKGNENVKRLAALGLLAGVETVFVSGQPRQTVELLPA